MTTPSSPGKDNILVRKYGGSSLETVDRIRAVARDICGARAAGFCLDVIERLQSAAGRPG